MLVELNTPDEETRASKRRNQLGMVEIVLGLPIIPMMMISLAAMLIFPTGPYSIIGTILMATWAILYIICGLFSILITKRLRSKAWGKDLLTIHIHLFGPLWTLSVYGFFVFFVFFINTIIPGAITPQPALMIAIGGVFTTVIIIQIIFCYFVTKGRDYYLRSENRRYHAKWEMMSRAIGGRLEQMGYKFSIEMVKKGYDRRRGTFEPKRIALKLSNNIEIIVCGDQDGTFVEIFPVEDRTHDDTENLKRLINDVFKGLTNSPPVTSPPKPVGP